MSSADITYLHQSGLTALKTWQRAILKEARMRLWNCMTPERILRFLKWQYWESARIWTSKKILYGKAYYLKVADLATYSLGSSGSHYREYAAAGAYLRRGAQVPACYGDVRTWISKKL